MRYGSNSAEYKRFKVSGLHNMTDADFHQLLRRVVRLVGPMEAELAPQGMTLAIITQLETLMDDFAALWDAQEQAIEDRNKAVDARVVAGNACYAEMVLLAELGKRLWLGTNESKYNEYVLYPNQNGEPKHPQQVVEIAVAPGAVVNLSLVSTDETAVLTAENLGSGPLTIYYSAMPTNLPPPEAWQLAANTTQAGTAAQARFVKGEREHLNSHNAGLLAGQLKVTLVG